MQKVSIVITTYKRPDTLRRAILSVLGQSYANIELIVVNDNGVDSPDNVATRKIVHGFLEHSARLKYIEHPKNKNGAAARNSGIKEATGEYITFLDDDDIFLKTRIEHLAAELSKDTTLQCVYSGVGFTQGTDVVEILKPYEYTDHVYQLLLQNSFFGTGSNFLCRTELVKSIGGFDELFNRHQDIEFLIRYLSRYPNIRGIDNILVLKTLDSRINFPATSSFMNVKSKFFSKFSNTISNYPAAQQEEIRRKNTSQIMTVAAMNKEYPRLGLNHLKGDSSLANPSEVVKNTIKWLILQLPNLAVFRNYVSVQLTKRRFPTEVSLVKNTLIGIDIVGE